MLATRLLQWTAEDIPLLDNWPDGYRYEASEGVLEVTPPPDVEHDDLPEQLQLLLQPQLPAGWRVSLGRAVRTRTGWRIPDLLVRAVPSSTGPRDRVFPAAEVALVVEVESPTGLHRDRVVKHGEYAEIGIGAYWRIEREPELAVVAYVLRNGRYQQVARLTDGAAELPGPVTLLVDLRRLRRPGT